MIKRIEQASLLIYPKGTMMDTTNFPATSHESSRPILNFPEPQIVSLTASWNEFGSATAKAVLRVNPEDAGRLLNNTEFKMVLIATESEGTIWRGLVNKIGWRNEHIELDMVGAFNAVGRVPLSHFFSKTGFEGWRETAGAQWAKRTPEAFNWFTKEDNWWGICPNTGHQYGSGKNSASRFYNIPDGSAIYGACGDIATLSSSGDNDWKFYITLWYNEGTAEDPVFKTGTNWNSFMHSTQLGRTGYWHNWNNASPGPTSDVANAIEIGIFRDNGTPTEYLGDTNQEQIKAKDFRIWGENADTHSLTASNTQSNVAFFTGTTDPSATKLLVPGQQVFIGPSSGTGQTIAYVTGVNSSGHVLLDRDVSYTITTDSLKWVIVPPSNIYKVIMAEAALAAPGLITGGVDNIQSQAFDVPDSLFINEDAQRLMTELKSYGHHHLEYQGLNPYGEGDWKPYNIYIDPESGQVIGEHTLARHDSHSETEFSIFPGHVGRQEWLVAVDDFSLTQADNQITEVTVVGEGGNNYPLETEAGTDTVKEEYLRGNPDSIGARNVGVWAALGKELSNYAASFKMFRERLWRMAGYRHTMARIKPAELFSLGFQGKPLSSIRPGSMMTIHNIAESFTEGTGESFSKIRIIETAYNFITGEGAVVPEADETDLSWVMVREEQQSRGRGRNQRFLSPDRRYWLR